VLRGLRRSRHLWRDRLGPPGVLSDQDHRERATAANAQPPARPDLPQQCDEEWSRELSLTERPASSGGRVSAIAGALVVGLGLGVQLLLARIEWSLPTMQPEAWELRRIDSDD